MSILETSYKALPMDSTDYTTPTPSRGEPLISSLPLAFTAGLPPLSVGLLLPHLLGSVCILLIPKLSNTFPLGALACVHLSV